MKINSKLLGAIALVSGTTVGAVTLSLPITLANLGVFFSLIIYLGIWFLMWIAALLTLEVSLTQPRNTSFISMAHYTLGPIGEWITWACFLSLLFALLTFYLSGILDVLHSLIPGITSFAAIGWVAFVACLLYGGSRWVDFANRYLVLGLLVTFMMIYILLVPHYTLPNHIFIPSMKNVIPALGIVITAFGYQVVIPSMKDYLQANVRDCRSAIFWGSFGPLCLYALWTSLLMGVTSAEKIQQVNQSPVNYLHSLIDSFSGGEWLSVELFIIFSITSSFLGIALGLYDFLKDGLGTHGVKLDKTVIATLTLLPPVIFVMTIPSVFFWALKYAVILVVILNLIIPALMSMQLHYVLKKETILNTKVAKVFQITLLAFALIVLIDSI
jgi:tyrosine-specific transport protein